MARKTSTGEHAEARKAEYLLKHLELTLVDEPVSEGITLTLKLIKMKKWNQKFVEAFSDGKSIGRMDPYTLLFLCEAPTFMFMSPLGLRERIGDMLQIKCPQKLYITKDLLKVLHGFKLLTGYVDVGKTYGREAFEVSSGVYEIFG